MTSDYDALLDWLVAKVPVSVRGKLRNSRKTIAKGIERQRQQISLFEANLRRRERLNNTIERPIDPPQRWVFFYKINLKNKKVEELC